MKRLSTIKNNIPYQVVFSAAGNPTGIVELNNSASRNEYSKIARGLMSKDKRLQQFGFLEGETSFYMSGGEFSGNGAQAAAWIIYDKTAKKTGSFKMSGLKSKVTYRVFPGNEIECNFKNINIKVQRNIKLANGLKGSLIDMEGITHFVLDKAEKFKPNRKYYKKIHNYVLHSLNLKKKPAVGVIWQKPLKSIVRIDPIVWVRDINSFNYETACGSGALAVLAAYRKKSLSVLQPSGKIIKAKKNKDVYSLASEVSIG